MEIGCLGQEGDNTVEWYVIAEQSGLIEILWGWGATLWVIASVAIMLGLVIFVHELGHFLAAKACGVKCEKFYIGFDVPLGIGRLRLPPALWNFRWGETEYGIGSLPLGGYVKMLGQDDNPSGQRRENERIRMPKPAEPGPADSDEHASPPTESNETEETFALDPRSFPAKPVWQRMIIISAGVVMNVIFAVVFAAIAYGMGVRYTPAIIGDTVADSPAWREGIHPGDQILQIGRRGTPDEQLRFRRDLMPQVILNGGREPLEVLVRQHRESQPEWLTVWPLNRYEQARQIFAEGPPIAENGPRAVARQELLKMLPQTASLGVTAARTTTVSPPMTSPASRAMFPAFESFQPGDTIVAVDGVPLPRDEATGRVLATSLDAQVAQRITEPVTLTVERAAENNAMERTDVTLPANPMRRLGMVMASGPIASVRRGTLAERIGLQAGDRLITLNGESLGDPLTLPQQFLEKVGQEVELQWERDGELNSETIVPEPPQSLGEPLVYGALLPVESLGIALPLYNRVEEVDPEGPAYAAGLRPGDEILRVQLMLEDEAELAQAQEMFPGYDRPIHLDHNLPYWYYVHLVLQRTLPDTSLEMLVLRNSADQEGNPTGAQTLTMTVEPVSSETWYTASRGMIFFGLEETRTSESWVESWSLGFRETWESVTQVLRVLQGLLTGSIAWTNLGGPITIATVAGYEAAEGFSQLLMFLTLLSANLAVLNFLPIPALDGGHMVFLVAEGVRGKPVDERLQVVLTIIGISLLLSLILILSIRDVGMLFRLFQ